MGISHKWNGTILTITSDSGTSSCDLKGEKGDTGVRGAQGRCGITLTPDGVIDTTGLATDEYVQGQMATRANALRSTKSGAIVKITDADALVNTAYVSVSGGAQATIAGKNLFNGVYEFPTVAGGNKTYARLVLDFLPAGTYTLSFFPEIYLQAQAGITVDKRYARKLSDGNNYPYAITITIPEEPAETPYIQFRYWGGGAFADNPVTTQIELGTEVAEVLTPYVDVVTVPTGTEVQLLPDVTTIYSKDAVVTCEYNRDINAAYEELRNAIISLGGNV